MANPTDESNMTIQKKFYDFLRTFMDKFLGAALIDRRLWALVASNL